MQIKTVASTTSTNADMLMRAAAGGVGGDWLRAERQTAGRGRMGREWLSPSGNLYASTIVRLCADDPPGATLALVAAVALRDALSTAAPDRRFTIKWPNDLMVGPAKIAGILLERSGDAVVVGFGVNLAFHPALDRPVTSLAALGSAVDAGELCTELSETFAHRLSDWRRDRAAIIAMWDMHSHPSGTPLRVETGDGARIEGRYDGLAPDGALRLRLADGSIRAIHAGDVFLV